MTIHDERYSANTLFDNLEIGDVFGTSSSTWVFMKTDRYDITGKQAINAISLTDGTHTFFEDDDEVVKLDADLSVWRKEVYEN